jgi:hypothetical protein
MEIELSKDERKKMLEEWRQSHPGAKAVNSQKDWDAEEERLLNGEKTDESSDEEYIPKKRKEPTVDPIKMMFKMFKNNYPIDLNITIKENIPKPTFIGMVQENVEADAIEYYSNLISDKLLKNPKELKEQVYKQLKEIINTELGIDDDDGSDDKNVENDKKE